MSRAPNYSVGPCIQIQIDEGGRFGRRPADKYDPSRARAKLRYICETGRDWIKPFGARVKLGQIPFAVLKETANEPLCALERVGRHTKSPLRPSKFSFPGRHRFERTGSLAIEIPPPLASVRDEVEIAVRRPFRLEQCLIRSTRNSASISEHTVVFYLTNPGLRRDPWHIGVIPGQPSQTVAVRTQAGCRIEVVPAREDLWFPCARDVYANQSVDDLTGNCMVFAHANDATALAVNDAICISKRTRPRRRDRAWLLSNIVPIKPLISEVGEINDPMLHNK